MENKDLSKLNEIITDLSIAHEDYKEFLKTYIVDEMYLISKATTTSFKMRAAADKFMGTTTSFIVGAVIFLTLSFWYYQEIFLPLAIALLIVSAFELLFVVLSVFLMFYHMFLADNILTALRTKIHFSNTSKLELDALLLEAKQLEATQEAK